MKIYILCQILSFQRFLFQKKQLKMDPPKRSHKKKGEQKLNCRICNESMNPQSYPDHLFAKHPGEETNLRPAGQSVISSFFGRRTTGISQPSGDRSRSPIQNQPSNSRGGARSDELAVASVGHSRPSRRLSPHMRSNTPTMPSLTPSPDRRNPSPVDRVDRQSLPSRSRSQSPRSPRQSRSTSPQSSRRRVSSPPQIID